MRGWRVGRRCWCGGGLLGSRSVVVRYLYFDVCVAALGWYCRASVFVPGLIESVLKESPTHGRPPSIPTENKLRILLNVLAGEVTIAEGSASEMVCVDPKWLMASSWRATAALVSCSSNEATAGCSRAARSPTPARSSRSRCPVGDAVPMRLSMRAEHDIPIYLATLPPAMPGLTGEIVGGWLGTRFVPEGAADAYFSHLDDGLARSARTRADLDV